MCEGDGWLDGGTVVYLVQCEDGVDWIMEGLGRLLFLAIGFVVFFRSHRKQ